MRSLMRLLLGVALIVGLSEPGRAATDLSIMQPAEIEALQTRLTDDGCYTGPIDGQASPTTNDAVYACPDQEPIFRIETGVHTATINQVGVDAACRLLATGSDDKTVRLWSLPDGLLQQVIRLPIGPGTDGKILAAALSLDGRFVAAGGYDAANTHGKGVGLYLTDRVSGTTRRVGVFDEYIDKIAFSSDGTRIALGLTGLQGIRILDRATGIELLADRDYGSYVSGLVFAGDGSLYTTSADGSVRRYGIDLKLTAKVKAPDGKTPYSIAIDPAGQRLAIGYDDASAVSILDAASLKRRFSAQNYDVSVETLSQVAWTGDGQRLIAGGGADLEVGYKKYYRFLRSFAADGKKVRMDVPVSDRPLTSIMSCGRGIVFGTEDPSFGLTRTDGNAQVLQRPVTANMQEKLGTALAVSSDATRVRFGLGHGEDQPVLFDLQAGTLTEAPKMPAGLAPAQIDGLPVSDWKNQPDPTFQGKPIALEHYERSRSLAIRFDRSGFVLGTEWYLRSFDAEGRERWNKTMPAISWGVDLSGSGRIVVAAHNDGTIRWYRWDDGQELLALFVHAPSQRWVAWTPTGYYMASPGAEDLIGWHVNRGWNQQADFFPASRFRDKFNRPDVVRAVLTTLDEAEALKQANASSGHRDDQKPLIERLPPVITILSPTDSSTVPPGNVEIRYSTRTPSGGSIDRVEAFVNGAKVEARGLGPSGATSPSPNDGTIITLPMPAHDAIISLVAYADGKTSDAARVTLKGVVPVGPTANDDALKPSLYALLIGVTHYNDKSFDLGYAAEDAQAFAKALKSQEGRLYRHVEVKVLTDKDATVPGVREGLVWLSRQTTSHDLAIVFEAGHGLQDKKGRFFFGTSEVDPARLFATAFSNDEMEEALAGLPGKKMLFMDACHAGAALDGQREVERVDMSEAINDFAQAESGMVVYGASTGREVSYENEQWGHGAFTKALLEGIGEGKADLSHKGTITTASLDFFLAERVKELTNGRQHPVMTRPKTVPDFPIASVQ